nr:MAG TPA: hypothetical protein [Crassvirales sp.]
MHSYRILNNKNRDPKIVSNRGDLPGILNFLNSPPRYFIS